VDVLNDLALVEVDSGGPHPLPIADRMPEVGEYLPSATHLDWKERFRKELSARSGILAVSRFCR
jgi:hypothetical protein